MPSLNNTKDALFEQIRKSYQTLQNARPKLLGLLSFPSGRKTVESLRNWYRNRQQTASVPVEETQIPEVTQNSDERSAAELTLPTSPQTDRPDGTEGTSNSFTVQPEEPSEPALSTTQETMAEMDVSKQANQIDTIEQMRNTPSPQTEEQAETLSAAQEITTETDTPKQNDLPAKKKRATKRASKPETIEQVGNIPSPQTDGQADALSTAQERTIETLEQTNLPTKKKRVTKQASQEKDTQTQ